MARLAGGLALVLVWLVSIAQIRAQDRPTRLNVWDIHIGDAASEIPDGFINYACGTDGGPPSVPLANFTEFNKCRANPDGLREVYFEYDDELEYWARALDLKAEIRMYSGTTAYEFPVVASVLFDDAGLAKGVRLVTDPRQRLSRDRREFWSLATFHPSALRRRWLEMQGLAARRGGARDRVHVPQEPLREDGGQPALRSRTTLLPEERPAVPRLPHREAPDGSL